MYTSVAKTGPLHSKDQEEIVESTSGPASPLDHLWLPSRSRMGKGTMLSPGKNMLNCTIYFLLYTNEQCHFLRPKRQIPVNAVRYVCTVVFAQLQHRQTATSASKALSIEDSISKQAEQDLETAVKRAASWCEVRRWACFPLRSTLPQASPSPINE